MKRLIVLIAAMALAASACGDSTGSAGSITTRGDGVDIATTTTTTPSGSEVEATTTTTRPATAERFVEVYFLNDDVSVEAVTRAVPDTPAVAANTITALLAGPTPAESDEGLSTAIPAETLLLGITIDGGLATIDLSREFESGGGSASMFGRLAQVVYTLTEFPTVDEVNFRLDGQPVTVFSGEGILLEHPVGRDDYASAVEPQPVVERWQQAALPSQSGTDPADLRRVVLVTEDDVLNVRSGAGVDNPIVGMLAPTVTVEVTGDETPVGSSTWVEIITPGGTGWVNAHFLGAVVPAAAFAADPAVIELLDEMTAVIEAEGDLRSVVSQRGLYVAHNARPIRFEPDELGGILTDDTTYQWGSAALEPGSPENPWRTFAEAVGDRFASTYDDPDADVTFDEIHLGGNGIPAEYVMAFELEGFHLVSVYDSGDDPQYGGLDWTAWYVSIDYEDGEPVVVALTVNEWSP